MSSSFVFIGSCGALLRQTNFKDHLWKYCDTRWSKPHLISISKSCSCFPMCCTTSALKTVRWYIYDPKSYVNRTESTDFFCNEVIHRIYTLPCSSWGIWPDNPFRQIWVYCGLSSKLDMARRLPNKVIQKATQLVFLDMTEQ